MYEVPLSSLYKVVASNMYEEGSKFCPVVVKIMDSEIIKESGGKEFLLQVWSELGEMVFEKALNRPPANWNLSGSNMVYAEETEAKEIHLVKLFIDK